MVAGFDIERCEALAARGAAGDASARKDLVELVWPFLVNRVRTKKTLRSLARSRDHVHNVVLSLVEKLMDQEKLCRYRSWRTENPGLDCRVWLETVIANEVRDYVRQVAGRAKRPRGDEPEGISRKLLLNEFATSLSLDQHGARPPMTDIQVAGQLLRFAENHLPSSQLAALTLWLEGRADAEIERELGLARGEGRRQMRGAIATIRRRFRDPPGR